MPQSTRRRFGQNFLDAEMSLKIAQDLPCEMQDEILEIGAGEGALTEHLLPRCSKLTAVEIDNFCIPKLQEKFKGEKNFNLIHKNFLQFDLDGFLTQQANRFSENEHSNGGLWLAGNLPYNMATAIIIKVLPYLSKLSKKETFAQKQTPNPASERETNSAQTVNNCEINIRGCMFMTQLEVAERITAKAGASGYGSLSVFTEANANAKIIRKISPIHFTPKPKVNSATILLTPLQEKQHLSPEFFEFVRLAFSQKRKTLANSLSAHYEKEKVLAAISSVFIHAAPVTFHEQPASSHRFEPNEGRRGSPEFIRAEQLSLKNLISIFRLL